FFQAEDGIRDFHVTGVQTCALPIFIKRLEEMKPLFVSVTYGAGGTTRDRTLGTVSAISERTSLTAAAHLTCVGAPRAEVDDVVRSEERRAGTEAVRGRARERREPKT